MARVNSLQDNKLKRPVQLFCFLLVTWGFYRHIVKLPDYVEETVFKPLIWIVPVVWLVLVKEKRKLTSIGWTKDNLFTGIYLGLGLGTIFAVEGLVLNIIKYNGINFSPSVIGYEGFIGAYFISISYGDIRRDGI